jgi:pimeloyl-ACP methyl ester carboxylesterase
MSKIPLLMLPGLLCDQRLWQHQALALSDVADVTIADLSLDDSMEGMARRALAQVPDRFALAGLSMGGYVAFEIMRLARQRVLRLALFDTSASPDSPERIRERMAGISSLQLGRFEGVTGRLLPRLIHPSRVAGATGDELKAMAARVGREAFIRQQTAILHRKDARPLLAEIDIPTLVGVGDSDVLTPPDDAIAIQRAIAGARLHIFQECGHLPAMECPQETAEVMRAWLCE